MEPGSGQVPTASRALAGTVFSMALLVPPAAAVAEAPSTAAGTQLVHVDVAVTDKKGQPVLGLTAGDFEVFDDGAPVGVANFQAPAVQPARRSTRPPGPGSPSLPDPPPALSTLIVYVDNGNLSPGNRNRLLDGLRRSLEERLAAGGTQALLIADVQGLKALTSLSTDARELGAAIDGLRKAVTRGALAASEERTTLDIVRHLIGGGDCLGVLDEVLAVLRQHANSVSHGVAQTLSRLSTVVQAAGTLPGPKTLLYVSEGFEQRPGIHLFHQLGQICPAALSRDFSRVYGPMEEHDASRALQELAALANALRVTIYTFDASGLEGPSTASVEAGERRYVRSASGDAIRSANLRNSQRLLADGTGGLSGFNSNLPDAFLAQLARDLDSHYALGFAPAREADGRVHRIGVRLKGQRGRGLKLRYRESYRHQVPAERIAERTLAALVFGAVDNPLGVSLAAGEPVAAAGGAYQVPLQISVPASPAPAGAVRLIVATRNATGQTSIDQRAVIREKRIEALDAAPQPFVVNIKLEAGEHDIAVGVYAEGSASGSYLRLHVSVPQRTTESGAGAR